MRTTIDELNVSHVELLTKNEESDSNNKARISELTSQNTRMKAESEAKEKVVEKLKMNLTKAEEDLLAKEDMIEEISLKVASLEKEKEQLIEANKTFQESILKDKNLIDKLQTDLNGASDKEV